MSNWRYFKFFKCQNVIGCLQHRCRKHWYNWKEVNITALEDSVRTLRNPLFDELYQ